MLGVRVPPRLLLSSLALLASVIKRCRLPFKPIVFIGFLTAQLFSMADTYKSRLKFFEIV